MTDFLCLFGRCDLVFELSKIALVCLNRMQEDVFLPILVQIGQKKANRQKKHSITEILKNCIFAKTEI